MKISSASLTAFHAVVGLLPDPGNRHCRRETPVEAISEQVRPWSRRFGPIWCQNCPRGSRKAERGGRRQRSPSCTAHRLRLGRPLRVPGCKRSIATHWYIVPWASHIGSHDIPYPQTTGGTKCSLPRSERGRFQCPSGHFWRVANSILKRSGCWASASAIPNDCAKACCGNCRVPAPPGRHRRRPNRRSDGRP